MATNLTKLRYALEYKLAIECRKKDMVLPDYECTCPDPWEMSPEEVVQYSIALGIIDDEQDDI